VKCIAPKLRVAELATVVGVCLIVGCGTGHRKPVPVSGKVLIDGNPVPAGFVRFEPSDARAAQGQIGADGRFSLTTYEQGDGCVVGEHRVAVMAFEQVPGKGVKWWAPKHYCETRTSDLVAKVDGKTDSLILELTWGADSADTADTAAPDYDSSGDEDPTKLD
jgi:hypothetical protein